MTHFFDLVDLQSTLPVLLPINMTLPIRSDQQQDPACAGSIQRLSTSTQSVVHASFKLVAAVTDPDPGIVFDYASYHHIVRAMSGSAKRNTTCMHAYVYICFSQLRLLASIR